MANKKLMDEDLRQANKSTSTLKTQAFKLANGTRYKATAADGEMGKFAGNNPAYPAGYMNPNLRPQNVAGNQVVPLPSGPSFTANTNTRVKLGNGEIIPVPATATILFRNVNPMLAKNGFAGMQTGAGAVSTVNMPAVIPPMNTFLPSSFVPVSLNGFQQPQPRPQNVINQPGFNPQMQVISPTASTMPPVMVNQPQRPTAQASPYTGTAGYWAGNNQTGASSYPATSYMAPNQQVNSTTNTGAPNLGQPQRPEGTYNPNNKDTAAQWRAYWNWEAANPQAAAAIALAEGRLSSAPVVMTREQIWQMKAAQRRKRASMNYESQSYVSPVSAASPYTGTGEFYSTILNTGSG